MRGSWWVGRRRTAFPIARLFARLRISRWIRVAASSSFFQLETVEQSVRGCGKAVERQSKARNAVESQ